MINRLDDADYMPCIKYLFISLKFPPYEGAVLVKRSGTTYIAHRHCQR